MSAFVLFHGNHPEWEDTAKKVFCQRRIEGGKVFSTSAGKLLLYPKQNVSVENYYTAEECSVYCVGTVVYKGFSYSRSLKEIASDYACGKLEIRKLRGAFVLLLDKEGQVGILTDETRMYRLYVDEDQSFVSTSFLAAASLTSGKINEEAVIEQILCGYVGGGQTLVQEVLDVSFELERVPWLISINCRSEINTRNVRESMNDRVKVHAQLLRDYLQDVKALSEQYGAECGLSGGCDSRLVFSSVNTDCITMKSVHTHQTSHVHDNEIKVVKKLSSLYKVPLTIVPTTYLPFLKDGKDDVLRENILYFDARNAGNIGAMSQTHTREYKKQVSGGAGVTFSGIGGEIYRNFYYTNLPFVNMGGWLENKIFEPGAKRLFPSKTYKYAVKCIAEKISSRTGINVGRFTPSIISKRYFDSYRIPYALGNVVNANNQMSFYLAPFTEKELIEEAKKDRDYEDHSGSFEGKIISEFDPAAAAVTSSRGFPLSAVPKSVTTKWKIMGLLPSCVWRMYEKRHRNNPSQKKAYAELKANSPYYREALSWFQSNFQEWNYSVVEEGSMPLNNFVFTVCAVYELWKNFSVRINNQKQTFQNRIQ